MRMTSLGHVLVLFSVFVIYTYSSFSGGFNGDDVIQTQNLSGDSANFLTLGRWAHYFVFDWIQGTNPGFFYSAAGLVLLVLGNRIAGRIIGFKSDFAQTAFLLASCISVYYGFLFDFSCSRFSYMIGHLAAMGGLWCLLNKRPLSGMLALTVAPAFFQVTSEMAGTILICRSLYGLLDGQPIKASLKDFLKGAVGIILALVLYYLLTIISYHWLGLKLDSRMNMSALAMRDNFEFIRSLLVDHTFPFFHEGDLSPYRSTHWLWPLRGIALIFLCMAAGLCWQWKQGSRTFAVIILNIMSLFAPFALALAAAHSEFPLRSLTSIAALHAFWVAFVLDQTVIRMKWLIKGFAMFSIACVFLFESAAQVNNFAYDRHLATQADLFATNRIVARIESVAANLNREIQTPQPLVVIYDVAPQEPVSPRGEIYTSRQVHWAKEWIFRYIDARFIPNHDAEPEARRMAQGRQGWPSSDSVFFLPDGTAVVVINQISN